MKHKKAKQQQAPISVRLSPQTREKVEKLASQNGLSVHAVVNLAAAAGVKIVERSFKELEPQAA